MWSLFVQLFPYAVTFTIPLLITALGGLFSERGGIVNIGLEGLMVMGSFLSAYTIFMLYPLLGPAAIWISLAVAALGSCLFSLLHAFACINLNANQVISGTAINMLAGAVTVYFSRIITGSGNIVIRAGLPRIDIPVLSSIPLIGRLFFTQTYGSSWLVLLILLASAWVLEKTVFGLRLKSCGEHPHAADAAGINVRAVRYAGVMLSGAMAGLGGAIILVTYAGEFNGSVAGLGFLALAALIFGQWKPFGILGATFFFGFASTLANVSQVVPQLATIPGFLLKSFPYVVTLLALMFFSRTTRAPKAAGQAFIKDST